MIRRESSQLEFKRNFNFSSLCEYGKILSSMANDKGGCIVFGVTENRPHEICGMFNNQFEIIDPSSVTNLFDSHFSPRFRWAHHIEVKNEIKIGFLYVEPSQEKPVICVKCGNRGEYKEGEIYFRYYGKTSLIKSSDLQKIINERIETANSRWRNILENIAKTSPSKAAILNTESGEFIGNKNVVIIDKDLLSEMKFIKEGEFNNIKGTPVYKIVGEIKEINGATIVEKETKVPQLIHKFDIISSFLDEQCEHPITFLKQLPYENTYYLPFWFYAKKSNLSINEVETIWEGLTDSQIAVRNKYIGRLKNENFEKIQVGRVVELDGNSIIINDLNDYKVKFQECKLLNWSKVKSELAIERSYIFNLIKNGCSKYFTEDFINKKYRLIYEAISNLEKEDIINNKEQILRLLKTISKINMDSGYFSGFRKSICYVDCVLNRDDVKE